MPNFACNVSQLPSIREAAEQEHRLRRKIERALAPGKDNRTKYFTEQYRPPFVKCGGRWEIDIIPDLRDWLKQ